MILTIIGFIAAISIVVVGAEEMDGGSPAKQIAWFMLAYLPGLLLSGISAFVSWNLSGDTKNELDNLTTTLTENYDGVSMCLDQYASVNVDAILDLSIDMRNDI